MGKILVLAEKPSVARDIARVLNCNQKGSCFIEGPHHVIIWGLGHLIELETPEHYDRNLEKWSLESLPMLPEKLDTAVIKKTSRHFFQTKEVMKRPDLDELVIATDAGREGELVARWIIAKAGWRKPMKRLWISSQTDRAVKDGFSRLRPAAEYDHLYQSARCRAESDWLVGLNITRALTCKYNARLSAGRVQTPTLALVVMREKEIRAFVPKPYWLVDAKTKDFTMRWIDRKSGQNRLFNREQAEAICTKTRGENAVITEVKKDLKKELPPLAYDLTELQRDANRRYGYPAKKTLNILQGLYERHKIVTYPRTDSRHLTDDIVPTLPDRLKSIAVGPYAVFVREILKKQLPISRRVIDNSKVSDHHALIPTEQDADLSALERDELNIFDLIVKRFLALFYPPFEYEQTTIKAEAKGELFYARGRIIRAKGWKIVSAGVPETENDEDNDTDADTPEQHLPDLKEGMDVKILLVKSEEHRTKPPARYTEATILSAMEHAGRFIDDKALREAIDKTSGLGTPATRAEIIEKLFDSFYIERRGREIVPTSTGIQLIGLVPADLKSPELTARWEQKLQLIGKGRENPDSFIRDIKSYTSSLVAGVKSSALEFHHDNVSSEKCPQCGKNLLNVTGKKGKMAVCPDRECGFRKSISLSSNARCPECHKKMEIIGQGDKKFFKCSCGHRENMNEFKQRKNSQVGKYEVQKYMKKQDTDNGDTYTLADAFKKIRDKKQDNQSDGKK